MSCVCGSKTHLRITHSECKYNQRFNNQVFNNAFIDSPTTSVSNEIKILNINATPNNTQEGFSFIFFITN